jgi:hypothetical protein
MHSKHLPIPPDSIGRFNNEVGHMSRLNSVLGERLPYNRGTKPRRTNG